MSDAHAGPASHERLIGAVLVICLHVSVAIALLTMLRPAQPALAQAEPVRIEIIPLSQERAPAPTPAEAPKPLPMKVVQRPRAAIAPAPVQPAVIAAQTPLTASPAPVVAPAADKEPTAAAPAPSAAAQTARSASGEADAIAPPRFDADYLSNPAPAYPAASRSLGEEGRVILRVQVGADGNAQQVLIEASSGHPRLDRSAREAVTRWRFVPARQGQQSITGWVKVPIVFELKS